MKDSLGSSFLTHPVSSAPGRWWEAIRCVVRGFLSLSGAAGGLPMLVQVAMLIAAVLLSLTALGIFLVCKRYSRPPSVSL